MRRRRDAQRLTQDDAADRAEIDRQQWYRIENGISGTRRDTIIRIAKALGWDEEEALNLGGFGVPRKIVRSKPQSVAEFVQRLSDMGFDFYGFSSEDLS